MSDCAINIRILFWHLQLTTYGKWRFHFNRWIWQERRATGFLLPLWIHEFSPSRIDGSGPPVRVVSTEFPKGES